MTARDYLLQPIYGADHELELLALQRTCFPDDTPKDPSAGGWWWLVRDRCDTPVAFASMHTLFGREGVKGYMTRSGVVEKHRGKGLQKRLIKAREAVARKHNLPAVVATTYQNGPSGNSLISCGFRLWEPDEPWMASGTNYWIKRMQNV